MSPASTDRGIYCLLFADVKGFSALPERVIPEYIRKFLGGIAALLDTLPQQPKTRNTWGDAIFLVFDDLAAAGHAALKLQKWCEAVPWSEELRLPAGSQLRLRLGLHAGPVFLETDPVIGRECYMGRHTSLAARLEPIAEEGQILASEEFAALCTCRGVHDFRFEYVGILPFKKGSQSHAVYLMLRS